jgi:hypothetical protein
VEKSSPKISATYFRNFQNTAQSKQLPNEANLVTLFWVRSGRQNFAGLHIKAVVNFKSSHPATRAARWFVFKPKFQIWVNFGGYCNGSCWYLLWTFGPFTVFWYTLSTFAVIWYFFQLWHFVPRKIWQPCRQLRDFRKRTKDFFCKKFDFLKGSGE